MKAPPPHVETVSCLTSTLRIYGKRSKFWNLYRIPCPAADPILVTPAIEGKDHAVRAGLDCCAEELNTTFAIKPAPTTP